MAGWLSAGASSLRFCFLQGWRFFFTVFPISIFQFPFRGFRRRDRRRLQGGCGVLLARCRIKAVISPHGKTQAQYDENRRKERQAKNLCQPIRRAALLVGEGPQDPPSYR